MFTGGIGENSAEIGARMTPGSTSSASHSTRRRTRRRWAARRATSQPTARGLRDPDRRRRGLPRHRALRQERPAAGGRRPPLSGRRVAAKKERERMRDLRVLVSGWVGLLLVAAAAGFAQSPPEVRDLAPAAARGGGLAPDANGASRSSPTATRAAGADARDPVRALARRGRADRRDPPPRVEQRSGAPHPANRLVAVVDRPTAATPRNERELRGPYQPLDDGGRRAVLPGARQPRRDVLV